MVQCGGPMTSLHRILPAITLGYSVTDLINGFAIGKPDFILHGFATCAVMLIFCELNVPHTIVQMLVMEVNILKYCKNNQILFLYSWNSFPFLLHFLSFTVFHNILDYERYQIR